MATAVVMMTVALGLFFTMINDLYIVEALIYDIEDVLFAIPFDQIQDIAIRIQIYTLSFNIICITGIFAIKFCFLIFFNNLLNRIRHIALYWRGVVIYTACAWAFTCGFSVYGCPYVDQRAGSCELFSLRHFFADF